MKYESFITNHSKVMGNISISCRKIDRQTDKQGKNYMPPINVGYKRRIMVAMLFFRIALLVLFFHLVVANLPQVEVDISSNDKDGPTCHFSPKISKST